MRGGNYRIINYLDDFIVILDTFESCQQVQSELIHLLISLGFIISWKKCTSQSQVTRFLGIDINSCNMTLSLPSDKLEKLSSELNLYGN